MKKKNNLGMGIIIIISIIGLLYFTGNLDMFSILPLEKTNMCTIPSGGGDCIFNLNVSEGMEESIFYMNVSFDSVAGSNWSEKSSLIKLSTDSGKEEDTYDEENYIVDMYGLPTNWPSNIQEIKVDYKLSGQATCGAKTLKEVEIDFDLNRVTVPYIYNSIRVCGDKRSTNCKSSYGDGGYLIQDYTDSDGDDQYNIKYQNTISGVNGIAECYQEQCECAGIVQFNPTNWAECKTTIDSELLNKSGIITKPNIFFPLSNTKIITVFEQTKSYKSTERGTGSASLTSITAQYKLSEYPENLKIFIGNTTIYSIIGVSNKSIITIDFANIINNNCKRDIISAHCSIPIVFRSDKGGIIKIEDIFEIKRISDKPVEVPNNTQPIIVITPTLNVTDNFTDNLPIICPLDIIMCDDGSHVGRVAPSCKFKSCPDNTIIEIDEDTGIDVTFNRIIAIILGIILIVTLIYFFKRR